MDGHNRIRARPWTFAAVVIILTSAHILVLYPLRHLALSATIVSGLVLLAAAKHLGAFGSVFALVRNRFRHARYRPSLGSR